MKKRPLLSSLERAWLMSALQLGFGVAFLCAGGALLLALLSYHPSDPGLLSATWRAPRNWLGLEGAIAADILHRLIGVAGYGVAALGLVWGARLYLGVAGDRVASRLVAAPMALLTGAALASSHAGAAASGGGHGGLLGDALFTLLLGGLPLENDRVRLVTAAALLALVVPPLSATALGGDIRSMTLGAARGWREVMRALGALWRGAAVLGAGAAAASSFRPGPRGPRPRPVFAGPGLGVPRSRGEDFERPSPRRPAPKAPPRPGAPAPAAEGLREPGFSDDWDGASAQGGARERVEPEWSAPEPRGHAPREHAPQGFGEPAASREPARPEPEFAPIPEWAEEARAAGPSLSAQRLAADLETRAPAEAPPAPEAVGPEAEEDVSPAADRAFDDVDEDGEPEPPLELDLGLPSQDLLEAIAVAEASVEEGWFSATEDDPEPPAAPAKPAEPAASADPIAPVEALDLDLLAAAPADRGVRISERALAERADQLQAVLQDYGVKGDIIHVSPGPVVSLFELEPAPGLKASRLVGLADDIARSMGAAACRISPVPGKNLIGIELPNEEREAVLLSELLATESFQKGEWTLPLALGKDIAGEPVIADLARMPHLLIAGTTGSGKSVAINAMLLSLFYRLSPQEARLILIDPKMLELSVYNGAPHLLAPVVTDPGKAVAALRWVVREMETRYQRMARLNVRSLESYNARVEEAQAAGQSMEREVQVGFDEETGRPLYETQRIPAETMPRIVVVIDEMADLMLVAGKEIERLVQRLAQMARASGIHLIMATQRPSVDVITGVIKANFPIRISFQVTSKIDSRTILNEAGAEQLLGKGDMLFTTGAGKLQRLHGPFVSDAEVEAVAAELKAMGPAGAPVDFEGSPAAGAGEETGEADGEGDGDSDLYDRAVAIVARERKCSTSFLQRRLQLGYNRAARLVDRMEKEGVVSPANHVGKREVLIPPPE